ncbi:exopolysaccharide biosynthesis protein [Clostridium sp. CAG:1219]|nr:exopolysaccharide biosynthesis protein [Clostridium sp. CAG:1219]
MKKSIKYILLFILFQVIFVPVLVMSLIYYGPFKAVREMLVTTAMNTMTHQYFATMFLDQEEIDEIIARNRPSEEIGNQDLNDIKISDAVDNGIELIDVSSSSFKGYLLIVNDPSRVKLATAPRLGTVGATTSQIVEANDAIGGINGGGFKDDALGTGGKPDGLLMQDGKLINGYEYSSYKVVGLDYDNKLIVSNSTSYSALKKLNVRDAVSFGPVIVINGQPTIYSGTGGYGIHPRSAIGQRKDGAILMLVIDGRQVDSLGATLKNVQDIMLQYGAYNAFNLDGGASSTLVYNNKVVNHPSDIMGERYVPCAFIITKAKK